MLQHISESGIYKPFFENHPDAVYVMDLEGSYIDANPACVRIFGYSHEELLDMSFRNLIVPEKLAQSFRVFEQLLEGESHTFETEIVHKDGHRVRIHVTDSPIVVDGVIIGIFGIAKDITEQKRTEVLLESVFKHARDGIIVLDHQNNVVAWNKGAENIFGYNANERVGSQFSLIIPEHLRTAHRQGMERYLATKEKHMIDRTVEVTAMCRDGKEIPIELSISTFSIGTEVYFIGVIREITERKRSHELLLQSEKLSAIGQLAAGVAHEIRNPLTTLKGFVQLLHENAQEPNRQYFEIMQSEMNRIEMILSEMLVLAKPQTVKYEPQQVDLILHEVITLLSAHAVMKNVIIEADFIDPVPLIECERNQLKQVFMNIIKNAIEAMPSGGYLHVKLRMENDQVCIYFIDEGKGIPKELIPRLGEPFVTTKEQGTGLGLMVSHRIISAHNGVMAISSEVEKGTTVSIVLPRLT